MLTEDIEVARRLESALDAVVGGLPYDEMVEWVETVEALLPKVRAAVAFHDAIQGTVSGNGDGNGTHPTAPDALTLQLPSLASATRSSRRLTKAHKIATVMATLPAAEWDIDGIGDQMRSREWMGEGDLQMHSLQNALSKMNKRKQLERVRLGVYRLTPEGLKLAQR